MKKNSIARKIGIQNKFFVFFYEKKIRSKQIPFPFQSQKNNALF